MPSWVNMWSFLKNFIVSQGQVSHYPKLWMAKYSLMFSIILLIYLNKTLSSSKHSFDRKKTCECVLKISRFCACTWGQVVVWASLTFRLLLKANFWYYFRTPQHICSLLSSCLREKPSGFQIWENSAVKYIPYFWGNSIFKVARTKISIPWKKEFYD
jgi:hypothetical protein